MIENTDDLQHVVDSFSPYIARLRTEIIVSLLLFGVGGMLGLFFSSSIVSTLLNVFNFEGIHIVTTSPYQFIDITLTIAFVVGVLFALPYLIVRSYFFLAPALRTEERMFILTFFPLSILLFAIGFGFGMWIMQLVINLYIHLNSAYSIGSYWDVSHFLSQILFTSFLTGLVFEIPIVISFLIRLHIFSYDDLAKQRKIVYAILVIIAILLPTTDLFSLVLETLPLFFLFEFGLLLNR